MLTPEELAALASDLESHRVERKAALSDKSKVEEAICAFSNDLPGTGRVGVLLIGVDDKTGRPTGLSITDETSCCAPSPTSAATATSSRSPGCRCTTRGSTVLRSRSSRWSRL